MTSGGTESILSAVKASRDYMCARRGITEPEVVIAESAHAAFFKAAEYFRIRLVKVLRCTCARSAVKPLQPREWWEPLLTFPM